MSDARNRLHASLSSLPLDYLTDTGPTITDPRIVERGPMGHVTIATTVTYPGEDSSTARFVGVRGEYGPVVMILPSGAQTFVTDPGRHGVFGVAWVRSFFASR